MGRIEQYNSFKSVPIDDGGVASVAWDTGQRRFISQSNIVMDISDPSLGVGIFTGDDFIIDWTTTRNDNSWLTVTDKSTLDYDTGGGSGGLPLEQSIQKSDFLLYSGPFDMQCDYNISVATGATSGNFLGMYLYRQSDNLQVAAIDWYKVGTSRFRALYNNLVYDDVIIENTGGKFRIRRDAGDSRLWVYYDIGSGWEWDGNSNGFNPWGVTGFPEDLYIQMKFQQGNGPGWVGSISNFTL